MSVGLFLIAIMGCGEADAPCEQLQMLDARYESQAACSAATESVLARFTDLDFPVVVAQCVAAGSAPKVNSGDVRLPAAEDSPLFPRS